MTSYIPKRNHLALGRKMFTRVRTASFPKTLIRYQNTAWARHLGFGDALEDDALWAGRFARFTPLPGSLKAPIALAYHGHQFGVYNPEIGDGRGILYAQIEDPADGRLLDLGTKGSGQTPYSRTADGRLTLKGAVREILATEMLEAQGVYTSKTFSVIETGEALERHDEPSPTRSAVLVRLSHSHIRIGSFQRLAYMQDREMLEGLLRYVAATYYPSDLDAEAGAEELAPAFVRIMGERMADLVAGWMAAGFVHGVLNTDNFNITGESFDYGPWRFIPQMTPGFTAAYFDHEGRYAYGRQPEAAFWALCRLADGFVDIASLDVMQSAVTSFRDRIPDAMTRTLCRRLGIDAGWDDAGSMTEAFIGAIRGAEIGFEEALFDWYGGEASAARALEGRRGKFYKSTGFGDALGMMRNAPRAEGVRPDHDYFTGEGPETMLIDEVEAIWARIAEGDDWSGLDAKIRAVHRMSEAYGDRVLPPEVRIPL
jgi:uncharacterized protein YdiU (UPF0061 family)